MTPQRITSQRAAFDAWKAELETQLRRYNAGDFRLNDDELRMFYQAGVNVEEAYGLTTDVAAGFTLPESILAWAKEGRETESER